MKTKKFDDSAIKPTENVTSRRLRRTEQADERGGQVARRENCRNGGGGG